MRVYLDPWKMSFGAKKNLCSMQCSYPRLDLCAVNNIQMLGDVSRVFGMTWRFLPLADPGVDMVMSRDLDSRQNFRNLGIFQDSLLLNRFSKREVAAVSEWIDANLTFHVMRDHPLHEVEIMGGMWGARLDIGHRKLFRNLVPVMIDDVIVYFFYFGSSVIIMALQC